ncbi:MAG: cbb3-type cytochrome oxidase assembly protein CcoS [Pseudomonadota bacterium]
MTSILYLIPIALLLGVGALAVFVWTVRSGQYDDLRGDGARLLDEDDNDGPLPPDEARLRRELLEKEYQS